MSDERQYIEDRLSSEYEIVQDKIDKIAAFRSTIRGWTVTLVTGAILAVASASFLSPYAPLFLLILLGIFASLEAKQNRNQAILEYRAFEIEVEFPRLHHLQNGPRTAQVMTPRIAQTLRDRSFYSDNVIRRFLANPDRWFYWVLVFLVIAVVPFLIYTRPRQPAGGQGTNINVINGPGAQVSDDSPEPGNGQNKPHSK